MAFASREDFARRQRTLAEFGELVLRSDDLPTILTEGCRLIAEALGTDFAKVLEVEHGRATALVLAGVGWSADVVGKARVQLNEMSSESFALEIGEPVVTQNILTETRFAFPEFMKAHGVVALVNVPIFLPGGEAFGLLQVDAREPRDFGEDDIAFLRTYAMILGPVIDRLRKVRDLESNSERFRLVVESARDYAILLSDPDDIITDWFAGAETVFGWKAQEIIGQPASVLFLEEDRASGAPQEESDRAREDGSAPNIRWHRRKDGSRVFIDGRNFALRAADGSLLGFMKIGQDTTERRRNEERQAVLLAELQHRVRNVLAMVRAVISKTGGASVEDFRSHLLGRISSLARTQTLLTRAAGVGVDLEGLIREELLSQAAQEARVAISGPTVTLAPKAAEVLSLAVHELATNALKYGALGQADGRLEISWNTEREAGKTWLRLNWQERGVSVISPAPRRIGFGTELITRRVPYELRGRGTVDVQPGGVRAFIEFPLAGGESVFQSDIPEPYRRARAAELTS